MTVVCPRGHQSETTDYCDQCGAPIVAGAPHARRPTPRRRHAGSRAPPAALRARATTATAKAAATISSGRAPAVAGWEAIVTADRDQFDRLAVAGVSFPADCPERRFALADGANRIGRSRGQPDEHAPEIDLAGPPVDPGISRLHACSKAAARASTCSAISDRRTARWSTTTRCRSPRRPRSRSPTAIASTSARGPRSPCASGSRSSA